MKRISLIVILALLLTVMGSSAVFAQSTTPNNGSPSNTTQTQVNSGSSVCGYGDLLNSASHGRLYTGPTFNMTKWLRIHHEFTMQGIMQATAKAGIRNSGANQCAIWVLPPM
jgi:hypothetical protein